MINHQQEKTTSRLSTQLETLLKLIYPFDFGRFSDVCGNIFTNIVDSFSESGIYVSKVYKRSKKRLKKFYELKKKQVELLSKDNKEWNMAADVTFFQECELKKILSDIIKAANIDNQVMRHHRIISTKDDKYLKPEDFLKSEDCVDVKQSYQLYNENNIVIYPGEILLEKITYINVLSSILYENLQEKISQLELQPFLMENKGMVDVVNQLRKNLQNLRMSNDRLSCFNLEKIRNSTEQTSNKKHELYEPDTKVTHVSQSFNVTSEMLRTALKYVSYPSYPWPSGHPLLLPKMRRIEELITTNQYMERLLSFTVGKNRRNQIWGDSNFVRPEALVSAGFRYDGDGTNVVCDACLVVIDVNNWRHNDEDNALYMHRRYGRSDCEFLRRCAAALSNEANSGI